MESTSRKTPEASEPFEMQFQASRRLFWLVAAGVVGDRTLAEDVIQEAALIGLSKYDQFEQGTDFTAWMSRIVRFTALNFGRAKQKHRGVTIESAPDVPQRVTRWDSLGPKEMLAKGRFEPWQEHFDDQVSSAIAELGQVPRACLLLKSVEGLEYTEISRLLDIPEGTAMSHVHRSRVFLRKRLSQYGRTTS